MATVKRSKVYVDIGDGAHKIRWDLTPPEGDAEKANVSTLMDEVCDAMKRYSERRRAIRNEQPTPPTPEPS